MVTEQQTGRARVSTSLLLTLALVATLSPMATDLYLPGLPQLADDLNTNASGAQLTLTAFLFGLATGQLVMGPVPDRFGRRIPLIGSMIVCTAAGVLAAVAPTLAVLVVARLFQGLSGAGGLVIGRAVIIDLTEGIAAAKALTLMMTVSGVAPVIAPVLGSLLARPVGWRGMLWALVVLCVVMVAAIVVAVPESLPSERRGARAMPFRQALRLVVASPGYRRHTTVFVATFALLMAYIAASPFVYQNAIGLSAIGYAIAFGINAAGMVGVGGYSTRLLERYPARRIVLAALGLALAATGLFLVLVVLRLPAWTYAIPLFLTVLPLGAAIGTGAGLAMSAVREVAGTGSALMGGLQFTVGAIVSPIVGLAGAGSVALPACVMVACAALALAAGIRT